jgi:uncharacterized protein YjbJ (UPF0337 family)
MVSFGPMLPDGSGRTEQNPGKKTGEENQKKGNLKMGWGKKTDRRRQHVQTARIKTFL